MHSFRFNVYVVYLFDIRYKKCNNFPFHYFPFPVHSYFTTEYAYAYSTQLSTVFQLCTFQAGICTYVRTVKLKEMQHSPGIPQWKDGMESKLSISNSTHHWKSTLAWLKW